MSLNEIIEETVKGLGFELVDFEQSPRARVLRLFIDKPEKEGGIDVDDCSLVSDQVSRVLMVENIDYDRLEVSSPGLDRVLKKSADFQRFCGAQINVRLRIPFNERRNFNGLLKSVDGGFICLSIENTEFRLALENIDKARLVPVYK